MTGDVTPATVISDERTTLITAAGGSLCAEREQRVDRVLEVLSRYVRPRAHPPTAGPPACDDVRMSRRDLAHVMTALWNLSDATADVAVDIADIDEAIGRGRADMRTPLNLQSLGDEGHTVDLGDGNWALTPDGIAWIVQERELS